jgi:cytochrome c553
MNNRSLSRKILRYAGITAASIVGLLLIAVVVVYVASEYRLRRKHAVAPRSLVQSSMTTEAFLEHGRHIATTRGCADCHGPDFGGQKVVDNPLIGQVHGPNITYGRGGLPSNYRDVDYVRAIRHGLSTDGRAFVLMPSHEYTGMSDEDLGALVTYLKTLPAVDRDRGPVTLGPLARVLMLAGEIKLAAEEIDHNAPRPERVEAAVTVEYGRYLAASCIGCHGENLSGGRIPGAPPEWPAASNLTPHDSGRLATWSEEDFVRALREAQRPDGSKLAPIMPAGFAQLTDQETKALWLYLRTLPAVATGAR